MAVRLAAPESSQAGHFQKVRAGVRPAPQAPEQVRRGLQPVAFLEPQAGGVDKPGPALPSGGADRQGRDQVRNLPGVHRAVPGGAHPLQNGDHGPVPLKGVRIHTQDLRPAPQEVGA